MDDEANRRGTNTNALASHIFAKHMMLDRVSEHEHSVVLDKRIFFPMLKRIPEEEIEEIGIRLCQGLAKQT